MAAVKRVMTAAAMAAALSLVACKDSTGPTAFNAANLDTQVQALSATFDGNAAFQSLMSLSGFLPTYSAVGLVRATTPIIAGPSSARTALVGSRRMPNIAIPRSPGGTLGLFPPAVLGHTVVWDTASSGFKLDTTIAGAPANGLRIRLYSVNTGTGMPVVPLQVLGYLELRDQSTVTADVLGVTLTLGTTTVADYTITYIDNITSASLTIAGYITAGDGTGRVNFNHALSRNGATETWISTLGTTTTSVRYELTGDTLGNGTELFRLMNGGNTLEFTGTATSSSFNGQITYNGSVIATITANTGGTTITGANGHDLTQAEQAHLVSLIGTMHVLVFIFFFGLFAPLVVVGAISISL